MKFQYEVEMNKHGLSYNDLPDDAQTGIDNIKDIQKALNLLEKTGKKPTEKTLKKVQAMDKWVTFEIVDFVNDTDRNDDSMPFDEDEVLEEINQTKKGMESDEKQLGVLIENEIKALWENGVKSVDIEDLKYDAPNCYDLLFDTYDPEEENGIVTSKFSMLEGADELFHIKKV
jgi:hypothetical protein